MTEAVRVGWIAAGAAIGGGLAGCFRSKGRWLGTTRYKGIVAHIDFGLWQLQIMPSLPTWISM